MQNICLLFGILPSQLKEIIERNSKGSVAYAADALQKSFIAGIMAHFKSVSIVNLPFIYSYPKSYKKIIAPAGRVIENLDGVEGVSLSYINLPIFKFLSKERSGLKGLKKWGERVEGEKVIIIYSAHSPLIKAAVKYKMNVDNNTKIILILPDLPEFMASKKRTFIVELLKKIDEKSIWKLYKKIDGFILLTKYMKERLPIDNKPYRVIEGIFNPKDQEEINSNTKKTIFYGGTLNKRYGILNLIKAFIKSGKSEYTLEICGNGDAKEEICKFAKKFNNIHYLGLLTREETLRKQREATLLVNPRTPEGVYTRYSFPSKTMEYLASGVPTLLYKLPGIPEEYYNYCFSISDLGVDALALKIREILEMPEENLKEIGFKAKLFILRDKNPKEQCKKLCDIINEVIKPAKN